MLRKHIFHARLHAHAVLRLPDLLDSFLLALLRLVCWASMPAPVRIMVHIYFGFGLQTLLAHCLRATDCSEFLRCDHWHSVTCLGWIGFAGFDFGRNADSAGCLVPSLRPAVDCSVAAGTAAC